MSVKQKYIKDENGEIFSPISDASSVIMNGVSIDQLIPETYLIEESGYNTSGLLLSGLSIPNWSMIKIYGNIARSSNSSDLLYIKLNGQKAKNRYIGNLYAQNGAVSVSGYNTVEANPFLGAIVHEGVSSYLETVIVRKTNNFLAYKSSIYCQNSSEANSVGIHNVGGQFLHENSQTLNSIKLVLGSGGLNGNVIIQIYKQASMK